MLLNNFQGPPRLPFVFLFLLFSRLMWPNLHYDYSSNTAMYKIYFFIGLITLHPYHDSDHTVKSPSTALHPKYTREGTYIHHRTYS